ncbi:Rho GTPase-activating protein 1 [Aphelenchoides besseyi]|nr:Rho GTPase-activating protein 1 [Aphelenchoides besseyi]KAI6228068.1 Rho GTPase-activating protein 1 [Aphelenchoides besseyi]
MATDFVEPEDGFADDDLLSPDELNGLQISDNFSDQTTRSFLESENFERELGSAIDEDPFAEDFSEIARYEIVNVIGEGDLAGRPIVVFYAYRLPSNKTIDHQKLLRYLTATLDKIVQLDYTIIYFHYGLRSHNKPPLKWLIQAYQILDRNYKKNLKALYIVHPTRFIRILWTVFKPFISAKFSNKLHYVNVIDEIADVRLAHLNVPQPILDHDESIRCSSKLPLTTNQSPVQQPRPTQQFDVSLQFILNHHPECDVPPIVTELLEFLRQHGMETEGIFRRSGEIATIRSLQNRINKGEKIDFVNENIYKGRVQKAVFDASGLLKTWLRSLGEPVITNQLYNELIQLTTVKNENKVPSIRQFARKLPPENFELLKTIIQFLTEVAANSKLNLMDANNLSVVFGPTLLWPTNQTVPITQLNSLNNFCYQLIVHYDDIFNA